MTDTSEVVRGAATPFFPNQEQSEQTSGLPGGRSERRAAALPGARDSAGRRRYTPAERRENLAALEVSGQSVAEFAVARGLSQTTVHSWVARERGGTTRRRRQKPKHVRYTPEQKRTACEAFLRSGLTRMEFARLWGVSPWTLSTWLRRYEEEALEILERFRHLVHDARSMRSGGVLGQLHHLAVASMLLLVAGCGTWPPIVDDAYDTRRLSVYQHSVRARGLPDSDIHSLERVIGLQSLDFQGGWKAKAALVTDQGLETLAGLHLPNLQTVSLGYNDNITDHGLICLAAMSPLEHVGVQFCPKITDEGLAYLAEHAMFESLSLNGCAGITDAGLGFLTANKHLKYLWLGDCPNITQEAVGAAQSAMPWARVLKDDAVLEGR